MELPDLHVVDPWRETPRLDRLRTMAWHLFPEETPRVHDENLRDKNNLLIDNSNVIVPTLRPKQSIVGTLMRRKRATGSTAKGMSRDSSRDSAGEVAV